MGKLSEQMSIRVTRQTYDWLNARKQKTKVPIRHIVDAAIEALKRKDKTK